MGADQCYLREDQPAVAVAGRVAKSRIHSNTGNMCPLIFPDSLLEGKVIGSLLRSFLPEDSRADAGLPLRDADERSHTILGSSRPIRL